MGRCKLRLRGQCCCHLDIGRPEGFQARGSQLERRSCRMFYSRGRGGDLLSEVKQGLERRSPPRGGMPSEVEPLNLPPGAYFPRMARPHHQHPGDMPSHHPRQVEYHHERAAASLQANWLSDRLFAAFQVVDPDVRNLGTFGNEFRNILILAATEVEAQAKGIMRANGYPSAWLVRPSKRGRLLWMIRFLYSRVLSELPASLGYKLRHKSLPQPSLAGEH